MKKLLSTCQPATMAELAARQSEQEAYLPKLNSVPAGVHTVEVKNGEVVLYKESYVNNDGETREFFAVNIKDLNNGSGASKEVELIPLSAFGYEIYMTEDGRTHTSSNGAPKERHMLKELCAFIATRQRPGEFTLSFVDRAVKIGSRYKTRKPIVKW